VVGVIVVLLALTGVVLASGFSAPSTGATSPARDHSARTARHPGPRAAGPAGRLSGGRTDDVQASPTALRTSCRSVAHIGDSTTVDLISPAVLPDPAQRLAARYAAVGVTSLHVNASGGRSIVEELPGQVNGYNAARAYWNEGFRGCWVFALGTNDAANVAAGSHVGLTARIERMMSVAHGEPVLWVNTRTQLTTSPWAESSEQAWDDALVRALAQYPNMRIFNWAGVAQPDWFLSDGIHYNSAGCAARAAAIADALARAFPLHGSSRGPVVG
jgi:lysophospholipase L1-like esterase